MNGRKKYTGVPGKRRVEVVDPSKRCQCGHGPSHHKWQEFIWYECLFCDDLALCKVYAPPDPVVP